MDPIGNASGSADRPSGSEARGPDAAGTAMKRTEPNPDTPHEPSGAVQAGAGRPGTKRGIAWILAGLVVTGVVAGYEWWRKLAK